MPVSVVLDHPHRHLIRRGLSGLSEVIGTLILIVGLAALLAAFALIFFLIDAVSATDPVLDAKTAVALFAIATTVMVSALVVGIRLLRGQRAPVLFLRRFGYTEATQAITFAVSKTIGRSWRLVTLDDRAIAPVGVAASTRRVFRVGGAFGRASMKVMSIVSTGSLYVAGGAAAGMVALGFITVHRRKDLHTLFDYPRTTFLGFPRPEMIRWDIPTAFYFLLVIIALALFLALFFAPAFAVALIALFPIVMFFWWSASTLEEAEKLKTAEVGTPQEIEFARDLVAKESRKLLAPRLVVLSVASSVWQLAVDRLADVASVLLFDISEPTENLLWEIEELTGRLGSRCIFVGDYDRVQRLAVRTLRQSESLDDHVSMLLDGQEVLAYVADRRGMKRFARALRNKLQTVALAS
jgi:hypothetical protein